MSLASDRKFAAQTSLYQYKNHQKIFGSHSKVLSKKIKQYSKIKKKENPHTCTNALTRTDPLRLNKKEKKNVSNNNTYLNVSLQYRQKDFFINWLYIR